MKLINSTFKTLGVLLFFTFTSFPLFAQIILCDGLYVNVQGDTIRGKIDNQNWVSNPEKIGFSATGLEKDVIFLSPKEVKYFKFIRKDKFEEVYVSRKIRLELSPTNVNYLVYESQPIWSDSADLFLKLLVKGRLSLYLYHDNIKKDNSYISKDHFFIEDEKGDIESLLFKKYLTKENFTKTNAGFKSQLSKKMVGCDKMDITAINTLEFGYKPIMATVSEYNNCFTENVTYKFKPQKRRKEFGVFAGALATSIELSQSTLPFKVFPTAGLYAKFPFALTSPKLHFIMELHPVFYSGATGYKYLYPDQSEFEARDNYKFGAVRLNLLVSYAIYMKENLSFTVFGGISSGGIFKNITNRFYVMKKDFVGRITVEESDIYSHVEYARIIEQGFVLGAKYKIGKFGLDLRYAKTNGWEVRPLFHSFITSFGLMSSYTF